MIKEDKLSVPVRRFRHIAQSKIKGNFQEIDVYSGPGTNTEERFEYVEEASATVSNFRLLTWAPSTVKLFKWTIPTSTNLYNIDIYKW